MHTKNTLKIYTKNASETDLSFFDSLVLPLSPDLFLLSSSLSPYSSLSIPLCLSSLSEMRDLSLREKRDREIKRELKERDKEKAGVERECLPGDDNGGDSDEGATTNAGAPLP